MHINNKNDKKLKNYIFYMFYGRIRIRYLPNGSADPDPFPLIKIVASYLGDQIDA